MFFNKNRILSATLFILAAAAAPTSTQALVGDASVYTVLNSSPLWADSGQSFHACNVANVSTSPITVRLEVISSIGLLLASSGATFVSIPAGASFQTAAGSYTGLARCRVTTAYGPDVLRANLAVLRPTSPYTDTLAVSEAR